MLVFEGADTQLHEAGRLYGLLDEAVRTWRFQGLAERLLAKADALYEAGAKALWRAQKRAEPADRRRLERLRSRTLATRLRLEKRALHRASLLGLQEPPPLGRLLDVLFGLSVENPVKSEKLVRYRVLFVLATLGLCVKPGIPIAIFGLYPPIALVFTLFAAFMILPGLLPHGPQRVGLTALTVVIVALLVFGAHRQLWWPSLIPLPVMAVAWAFARLRRHAS